MSLRRLIVNGDDFGQTPGTTDGIIRAHAQGVLTSASLMVRWLPARIAAAYARSRHDLSVGLHLDLGEWMCCDGNWVPLYEVAPLDDARAVEAEGLSQLERFRRLVGREPTHLDSHQHVHRTEPVRSVLRRLADRLGIPLRGGSDDIRHCGDFYGQTEKGAPLPDAIGVDALVDIIGGLPAGTTELSCHPSTRDDVESMYRAERCRELHTLCDPRVRATLQACGVVLQSFGDAEPPGRPTDLQMRI